MTTESETAQKPAKRRPQSADITLADAAAVAELCAKRLTETEACRTLGIDPNSWRKWKCRSRKNGEQFERVLDEIKGKKINALIENIEAATKEKNLKTGMSDWRASAELLRMLEPARFNPKLIEVNVNTQFIAGIPNDVMERARDLAKQKAAAGPVLITDNKPLLEHSNQPQSTAVRESDGVTEQEQV